jgi:hypothetical protein
MRRSKVRFAVQKAQLCCVQSRVQLSASRLLLLQSGGTGDGLPSCDQGYENICRPSNQEKSPDRDRFIACCHARYVCILIKGNRIAVCINIDPFVYRCTFKGCILTCVRS